MTDAAPDILTRENGATIAYRHRPGRRPGVLFCCGFKSDMTGTKARRLDDLCRRDGRQYTRFDYQGHGASSGRFEDGTIGAWFADTLAVFDRVCEGPQVIVGSSMGGWMALLLAKARRERVAGLVLVAPAADFATTILWQRLPAEARRQIETDGVWYRPSVYGDGPYPITRHLIEESRVHNVLDQPIPFDGPVRILHGMRDDAVPVDHVLRTAAAIASDDVQILLVKDGEHRLSREADLDRLEQATAGICSAVAGDEA